MAEIKWKKTAIAGYMDDYNTLDGKIDTEVSTRETQVGTLASLTTTEKTNLVGAVNEVNATLSQEISDRETDISTRLAKSANLSDLDSVSTARTNLDVYSKAETGIEISGAITASESTTNAELATKVDLDGSSAMTGDLSLGGHRITNLASPIDDTDAVTKGWVTTLAQGFYLKEPAKAATLANITLSGLQTIDGVELSEGDRVLVKDQTDPVANGVYEARANAWVRTTDFDDTPSTEVQASILVFVSAGVINAGMGFAVAGVGDVVVDTDAVNFQQITGLGQVVAGAGIKRNGNELYISFGAGIVELPDDEVGIDVKVDGGLWLTVDGLEASADAAAKLAVKLDGTSLSLSSDGLRVSAAYTNAVATDISDAITTAQNYADTNKLDKASNLSDVASVSTARTNLDVYSKAEVAAAISNNSSKIFPETVNVGSDANTNKVTLSYTPINDVIGIDKHFYYYDTLDGTTVIIPATKDVGDVTGKTWTLVPEVSGAYDGKVVRAIYHYTPGA